MFDSDWDYLGINRGATAVVEHLRSLEDQTLSAVAALINNPDLDIQVILRRKVQYEEERGCTLPALAHHVSDVTAEDEIESGATDRSKEELRDEIKTLFFPGVS